jgi:hypothetical protein
MVLRLDTVHKEDMEDTGLLLDMVQGAILVTVQIMGRMVHLQRVVSMLTMQQHLEQCQGRTCMQHLLLPLLQQGSGSSTGMIRTGHTITIQSPASLNGRNLQRCNHALSI